MKRIFFTLLLSLSSLTAMAMPYYSKRQVGRITYLFHGQIKEMDEPFARSLETKFMESRKSQRWHYQRELGKLGISVERLEGEYHKRSQLPYEVEKPSLPDGVKG